VRRGRRWPIGLVGHLEAWTARLQRVGAKAYFLGPEERPRHRDVDLRDPLLRYELLAD